MNRPVPHSRFANDAHEQFCNAYDHLWPFVHFTFGSGLILHKPIVNGSMSAKLIIHEMLGHTFRQESGMLLSAVSSCCHNLCIFSTLSTLGCWSVRGTLWVLNLSLSMSYAPPNRRIYRFIQTPFITRSSPELQGQLTEFYLYILFKFLVYLFYFERRVATCV